jgi:hypothetical protein
VVDVFRPSAIRTWLLERFRLDPSPPFVKLHHIDHQVSESGADCNSNRCPEPTISPKFLADFGSRQVETRNW